MPVDLLQTAASALQKTSVGSDLKIGSGKTSALAPGGGVTKTFADTLGQLVGSVEKTAGAANTAVTNMLDKTGDVHDAMIALQRAEMTFQLTVQVRNKLMSAYQDVMKMSI
jgi:flagellar hook-basal body complex protein FliE